jgi:hypothetical protein
MQYDLDSLPSEIAAQNRAYSQQLTPDRGHCRSFDDWYAEVIAMHRSRAVCMHKQLQSTFYGT